MTGIPIDPSNANIEGRKTAGDRFVNQNLTSKQTAKPKPEEVAAQEKDEVQLVAEQNAELQFGGELKKELDELRMKKGRPEEDADTERTLLGTEANNPAAVHFSEPPKTAPKAVEPATATELPANHEAGKMLALGYAAQTAQTHFDHRIDFNKVEQHPLGQKHPEKVLAAGTEVRSMQNFGDTLGLYEPTEPYTKAVEMDEQKWRDSLFSVTSHKASDPNFFSEA